MHFETGRLWQLNKTGTSSTLDLYTKEASQENTFYSFKLIIKPLLDKQIIIENLASVHFLPITPNFSTNVFRFWKAALNKRDELFSFINLK